MDEENKIIRTICYFTKKPDPHTIDKVERATNTLINNGFIIQTKRVCSPVSIKEIDKLTDDSVYYLSVGSLGKKEANGQLEDFFKAGNVAFNIDLSDDIISWDATDILFKIIRNKPSKTFLFTYTFNNPSSSPFIPSATYAKDGFSIGLQPTDLAQRCKSIESWLNNVKEVWEEVFRIFQDDDDFLGIDSSIAPLGKRKGSFINFIKRLGFDLSYSAKTSIYLEISKFIKQNNPKPIGLCGIMFPCLEDFELADEYEKGKFTIERNIYFSLHSGLGIDCYPVGIDEDPKKITGIFTLIQGLSNKYGKPFSARFVSDGKAKIGEKTDFKNQYLKDVVVRKL